MPNTKKPVAKKSKTGVPEEVPSKATGETSTIADLVEGVRDVFSKPSCFSCFGSVEWNHPVDIYYQRKGDAAGTEGDAAGTLDSRKLRLPVSVGDLAELVRACDVASFGNGEQGTGGSDMKAYTMDTNRYATSFDIARTGILNTVQTILAVDPEYVIAEPRMLSIYQNGGPYKHESPPAPEGDILGQLVVTLPQNFTGGDLILQHKDVDSRGSAPVKGSGDTKQDSIHWAAFSSTCVHEVAKVTSGARISLTYNLRKGPPRSVSEDLQPLIDHDLYAAMDKLFSSGKFDSIMGFPLEHMYPSGSAFAKGGDETKSMTEESFKGRDLLVSNTLTCLAKKHPTLKVERDLVAMPEGGEGKQKYMYIQWGRFHHGSVMLEDLVPDANFFQDSYSAESLEVTWVREPREVEFVYQDEARMIDHRGSTCSSQIVSCAGCLLAFL